MGRAAPPRTAVHLGLGRVLLLAQGLLALVTGRLAWLTVVAWREVTSGRDRVPVPEVPATRFAVLVPAHDEERGIGPTLESLATLDYPRGGYEVHVVADHCSDATADVVVRHGLRVHERNGTSVPGKGPALMWLLARLRADEHDAVVVVDADTVVDPMFLRAVDARMQAGCRVVQGSYAVREPGASTPVALRSAALAVRHHVRPLARAALGGSAGLYGNGMAFASGVLEEHGMSGHLTEDLELEVRLLLAGQRVAFAADALVHAEMPQELAAARTQNERWERGRLEVARGRTPELLRAAVRGGGAGRRAQLDAVAELLLPPLSLLGAAVAAAWTGAVALWLLHPSRLSRRNVGLATASAVALTGHVVAALRIVRAPAAVWRSLLGAPRLVLWKLGVVVRAATARDIAWQRTERNP